MVQKEIQEKEIKTLKLITDPHIHVRSILFDDDEDERKDKNKKQFITCTESWLEIIFTDNTVLTLYAPKGYKFDGATIPFGIGKGNMKLQIPALFHDIMCDDKAIVNYNRNLASEIFKEALIDCGVNRFIAHIMYLAVEAFQKLCCDWRKPDG